MIVQPEIIRDLLIGQFRHLADNVHGDMARRGEFGVVLARFDIRHGNAVGARNFVDDLFNKDRRRVALVEDVADGQLRRRHIRFGAVQLHERLHVLDRAFELTDVVLDLFGDKQADLIGQLDVERFCLALDDGDARFQIGRLNVGDQAAFKAVAQALLQRRHLFGRTVGGEHDLALGLDQRVERVEKFQLRRGLAGDELHVVDQQNVGVAVFVVEYGRVALVLQVVDQLIHEILAAHVDHVGVGIVLPDLAANGVEQMGLA